MKYLLLLLVVTASILLAPIAKPTPTLPLDRVITTAKTEAPKGTKSWCNWFCEQVMPVGLDDKSLSRIK